MEPQPIQGDSAGKLDTARNYNNTRQENVASAMANPCPYPTCHQSYQIKIKPKII